MHKRLKWSILNDESQDAISPSSGCRALLAIIFGTGFSAVCYSVMIAFLAVSLISFTDTPSEYQLFRSEKGSVKRFNKASHFLCPMISINRRGSDTICCNLLIWHQLTLLWFAACFYKEVIYCSPVCFLRSWWWWHLEEILLSTLPVFYKVKIFIITKSNMLYYQDKKCWPINSLFHHFWNKNALQEGFNSCAPKITSIIWKHRCIFVRSFAEWCIHFCVMINPLFDIIYR